jgi:hypothetical protein
LLLLCLCLPAFLSAQVTLGYPYRSVSFLRPWGEHPTYADQVDFFFHFSTSRCRFSGMRPKVVLVILLGEAAGLAGLFFLKPTMVARPQTAPVPSAQTAVPSPA